MVDRRNMPVEDLIRSQLQSEEEFTDQRFSFQTVYSRKFQITAEKNLPQTLNFDFSFGTIMTKLKIFHVIERKMYHARQTFEINCHL